MVWMLTFTIIFDTFSFCLKSKVLLFCMLPARDLIIENLGVFGFSHTSSNSFRPSLGTGEKASLSKSSWGSPIRSFWCVISRYIFMSNLYFETFQSIICLLTTIYNCKLFRQLIGLCMNTYLNFLWALKLIATCETQTFLAY